MRVSVRLVQESDAASLAGLLAVNREFLAPWEPSRPDGYATEAHQRFLVREVLTRHENGAALPLAIVVDGQLVGRVTVSDIVRGPFLSGHLGYWVAEASNGRGVATAAVAATVAMAFDDLGLHRLQAGTLLHNDASQRVLTRNGFGQIGLAPAYLRIADRWQDHLLFQRIAEPSAGVGLG